MISKSTSQALVRLLLCRLIWAPSGQLFTERCLFVCVEVLWPSQPNGVMSSAVSLPNHMLTGQA